MSFRMEYPRPQLVRDAWLNLNGAWQFEFDDRNVGTAQRWFDPSENFSQTIQVPFAFQTPASGIHDTSFHDYVWYKRNFTLDSGWYKKRVVLHFGAVDYRAWVYVNGHYIGMHEGGHTPFSFDITHALTGEEEQVTVRVEDPSKDETIPRGKQFWLEKPDSIWYTRTTGIWQTVWLEAVNPVYIHQVKFQPDLDQGSIGIEVKSEGDGSEELDLDIRIFFRGVPVIQDRVRLLQPITRRMVNLFGLNIFRTNFHHAGWTWTPETPNLFDVKMKLYDHGVEVDCIQSYFGMRKIHAENGMVYLNNKPYYQKLVLDQGYWQEGLLTAPTDEHLRKDIELAKELGFNGCRKHQKVEDPRFLYWADRIGFLVWGECAANASFNSDAVARLTKEWIEIIDRDFNHPSIVAWVPLNESWGIPMVKSNEKQQYHSLAMYSLIHSLDDTRLVISNDGWEMTLTDICAVHNYQHGRADEPDKYEEFKRILSTKETMLASKPSARSVYADGYQHRGEPILLTEFGGISYKAGADDGWGYTSAQSSEDLVLEYERIMKAIYASKIIYGYCYTQLTDVEQEINGLLAYDRTPKCDMSLIKEINSQWHLRTV